MQGIIESVPELEKLLQFREEKCFIGVISDNDRYHPKLVDTVAIYIRPKTAQEGYIIPINHPEGQNLGKSTVFSILNSFIHLYTLSKKELIYHGLRRGLLDVPLLAMLQESRKVEINTPIPVLDLFYRYHGDYKQVNALIPLVKLHEKWEHAYQSIKRYLDLEIPDYFTFYNEDLIKTLFLIEQQGIGVNKDVIAAYKMDSPRYSISGGRIYTNFHITNPTTRPSNSFNGINFAAIPKTEEIRSVYEPKNDFFVQFDFDSYHLRLVAGLIGYHLTEESGHMQLARQYFKGEQLTEEHYSKAKQLNFEAIYGRIPKSYEHLEFFEKLQAYIQQLWKKYKEEGYILDPISKRKVVGDEITHGAKLLNYLIQSLETSRNILILKQVLKYLSGKRTKVVHYIYDAVILDVSKEDGKEVLHTVQNILSEGGKYPVKISAGKNFCL